MYTVTIKHLKKVWIKGDLDSDLALEEVLHKKTRKEAKEYMENFLRKYKKVTREYTTKAGETSYCYAFTGNSWVEENTGEKRDEYYQLELKKI